jgi:DNA-binding transcriptional LysR family regulator
MEMCVENLTELFTYAKVVENQGFSAASRKLGLPKSTLSKRVSDLERRLGVLLIARSSRAFRVTDVGQEVYRHAQAMIVEADAAAAAVEKRRSEPAGIVRLTASAATCQSGLNHILHRLAEIHPKLQVILHASNSYVDLVQEGFDLAVRAHYESLKDSSLIQRRLGTAPAVLVASGSYLELHGVPKTPYDLDGHSGLFHAPAAGPAIWRLRSAGHRPVEVRPHPRMFADEPSALVSAAIAGLGIAALPLGLCRSDLERRVLVRALPEWDVGRASVSLLTVRNRDALPSVRAVRDFLVASLPKAMSLRP